jgi:hypothetical protein
LAIDTQLPREKFKQDKGSRVPKEATEKRADSFRVVQNHTIVNWTNLGCRDRSLDSEESTQGLRHMLYPLEGEDPREAPVSSSGLVGNGDKITSLY